MFTEYIDWLLQQADYSKDESGYIVASIAGHQGFYSQGENFEQARLNLRDAIEGVIVMKLSQGDKKTLQALQGFTEKGYSHA